MASGNIGRIREIVCRDLDSEFIESIAISTAWEYNQRFEELAGRPDLPEHYRNEEFGKDRGRCAVRALVQAAKKHGVPFNFRRLDCNGQNILLVKAGRVILIQEPMASMSGSPRTSDYKAELADTHGLIRQLELDLGDQPLRILDWSGCIFGVLLHSPVGPQFTREHKSLGGLMLGVPDALYSEWVVRIDLHDTAMFGLGNPPAASSDERDDGAQGDRVNVTLKKKRARGGQK